MAWKAWENIEDVRTMLESHGLSRVSLHSCIHSTTLPNFSVFWSILSKTCAFADLSKVSKDKIDEIQSELKKEFGVDEKDVIFMVLISNLSISFY